MSKAWTPSRVELLRVLHAQGQSGGHIAKVLNMEDGPRLSRNAVIGKLHRLGLVADAPSGGRARKVQFGGTDAARAKRVRSMVSPTPPPSPVILREPPKPGPNSVRFIDRDISHQCPYPISGEGALMLVCGEAKKFEEDWCERCARLVYVAPQVNARNLKLVVRGAA